MTDHAINPDTIFLRLRPWQQKPINGGCSCKFCKAHPDRKPMWDTLAADPANRLNTWIVHYPELT